MWCLPDSVCILIPSFRGYVCGGDEGDDGIVFAIIAST